MALFIKEIPMNRFNPIRWHQTGDFEIDGDRFSGYQRCTEFTTPCGEEVAALPAIPGDYIAFTINSFSNYIGWHPAGMADWAVGMLTCCELLEGSGSLTAYATNGTPYPNLSSVSTDPGTQVFLAGDFNVPALGIGTQFNLCIYDQGTGAILYVSNPFLIVPDDVADCQTQLIYGNHTGTTITLNTNENGQGNIYFPANVETMTRFYGKLRAGESATTASEYLLSNGKRRRRNITQVKLYTLGLFMLDNFGHEGFSFLFNMKQVQVYSADFEIAYSVVPAGEYAITHSTLSNISTAEIKLQENMFEASFQTC